MDFLHVLSGWADELSFFALVAPYPNRNTLAGFADRFHPLFLETLVRCSSRRASYLAYGFNPGCGKRGLDIGTIDVRARLSVKLGVVGILARQRIEQILGLKCSH